MHIGDFKREQAMRCEVFKQENEFKETELKEQSAMMSEQMRIFQEAFELRKQTVSQHLNYINVLRNDQRQPLISVS